MNTIKSYFKTVNGVSHTTFNPNTPGCVRVHLIPPKKIKFRTPWLVILNGKDILPISSSWAILLKEFIDEVNKFQGQSIPLEEVTLILERTVNNVKQIFEKTSIDILRDDLKEIINILIDIGEGKNPSVNTGFMRLKDYAKYMNAPHRMDLMISSMYKNNKWHCNQKCIHCYAGNQEYAVKEELTTDEWKKIIDKCKKARIPQITFTGGEPTLREDLVELIEYSKWFVTRLNTNGVLLTKDLCNKLYNASLDNIQITVYSHNEHIHNLLVGASNFNKTIEGLKNAKEANLFININTPLCSLNKDYLNMVKFFHQEYGITYFTCSGLIVTGNAVNDNSQNTQLSKEEITEVIKEVHEYIKENDLNLSFTSPGWIEYRTLEQMKLDVPTCGACLSNMAISPNGEVIPCQSWLSNDGLGNLLHKSWESIWTSKKCKKIKKKIVNTHLLCPLTLKNKKEGK